MENVLRPGVDMKGTSHPLSDNEIRITNDPGQINIVWLKLSLLQTVQRHLIPLMETLFVLVFIQLQNRSKKHFSTMKIL